MSYHVQPPARPIVRRQVGAFGDCQCPSNWTALLGALAAFAVGIFAGTQMK